MVTQLEEMSFEENEDRGHDEQWRLLIRFRFAVAFGASAILAHTVSLIVINPDRILRRKIVMRSFLAAADLIGFAHNRRTLGIT